MLAFVRRRGPATGILVACLLLSAGLAHAAPRLAALTPILRGGGPELRDRFHEAVTHGIAAAGFEAVPAAEVRMRLAGGEDLSGCSGPGPCAARAAMNLRTNHTVASEVVIAGKDYTIRLKLLDAAGREIGKAEESCDICTVKEADEAVTRATTKMVLGAKAAMAGAETTPPPPPPKAVEPPPPPPKAVEPPPPPPKAVEPTPAPLKTADTGQPPEKKMFPWRWVGIGSLAAGVVGLAVGIPLVVIDGNPTCTPPAGGDPRKLCKEVYNTAGGGGTLLALGAAGVAAGAVMLYLDHRARHRTVQHVSVVPMLEGGVLASVGGRF